MYSFTVTLAAYEDSDSVDFETENGVEAWNKYYDLKKSLNDEKHIYVELTVHSENAVVVDSKGNYSPYCQPLAIAYA